MMNGNLSSDSSASLSFSCFSKSKNISVYGQRGNVRSEGTSYSYYHPDYRELPCSWFTESSGMAGSARGLG